ncbi:MAG: ACP S-malonyltransferase [Desulfobulbaceae bacterium]|nr:ACP S-malonyltransferase [Desulfobulbaceae bacterium]
MKKTAIIFPGQGSQFVGMGREFIENDSDAKALMEMANVKSGLPLRKLCLQGPMEELTRAQHLQPALSVINLICWQQLKKALPDFRPAFLAGHSLGECSALHAAGVLSAEDTVAMVIKRGKFMEREGAANPGGMRAVLGMTIEDLEEVLGKYPGPGVAVVANHNSEKQVVISGDIAGLDQVSDLCREQGARVIPLKVNVANHSPLVAGAIEDFSAFMETLSFHAPRLPVLFNVTANMESDPAAIRSLMARQIASRVRWLEIIQHMVMDGVEVFIELGPKTVLSGLMKKILPRKSEILCLQADTPEAIDKVVAAITA